MGAPCPICYRDLCPNIPKEFDWSDWFMDKRIKAAKSNEDKKKIYHNRYFNDGKQATIRSHVKKFHPHYPVWNAYRKQEKGPSMVVNSIYITMKVYKEAVKKFPFEDFFPSTQIPADTDNIDRLFADRFRYAIELIQVSRIVQNLLHYRKVDKSERANLRLQAKTEIENHKAIFEQAFDEEQRNKIRLLSYDQVRSLTNVFFLYVNGHTFCRPFFSSEITLK